MSIQDQALHLRLDDCIEQAEEMYEKMTFSQAVKWGWHVVKQHVAKYRKYSLRCGVPMHGPTLRRVIKAQVIMLSPIITHWSEYVWRTVLKEEGSVTQADWPEKSTFGTDGQCCLFYDFVWMPCVSLCVVRSVNSLSLRFQSCAFLVFPLSFCFFFSGGFSWVVNVFFFFFFFRFCHHVASRLLGRYCRCVS